MRKKLFSTILFVAMCLTISSPVLAASHADDVIQRNPNRYYYVYEYGNTIGPYDFEVSSDDASSEAAFRSRIIDGTSSFAGAWANAIGGDAASVAVEGFSSALLDKMLPKSPFYRWGIYTITSRIKTKYRVDSLDTSKRVPEDKWLVSDCILKQNGKQIDTFTITLHLK